MNKKKILIATENITRIKDLIYSGIIDDMEKKYDLEFLIENKYKFEDSNYNENKTIEFEIKNKIFYKKKNFNFIKFLTKNYTS